MVSKKLVENIEAAAALLDLLGNDKRLIIVSHLIEGEMSVGAIAEKVELSQSALSQHLARLRREKIVAARRSGQTVFYSLSGREATAVLETLYRVYCESSSVEPAVTVVTEPQPVL